MRAQEFLTESKDKCPPATQDIAVNLKNRQKAIDEYGYGPLNPDLPNTKFWMKKVDEWNLDSADEAKQSLCGNCAAFDQRQATLACIAQGIDSDMPSDAEAVIDAGDLGYCKFLKFKCASRRTCDAWVTGGPLTDDKPSVAEGFPNFNREWDEATRYPEFVNLGKEKWIELVSKGKPVTVTRKNVNKINNTDAADPKSFKLLDPEKQKRALAQLANGDVEMPIVARYSDGYLELIGGNTRLTAQMAKDGQAKVWLFNVPEELTQGIAEGTRQQLDFDSLYGKVFKITDNAGDPNSPGFSIVTPLNGESWNWRERPEFKKIVKQKLNDPSFLGDHKYQQIIDAMAGNKFDTTKHTVKQGVAENFADGKVKGKSRPGRVKRAGASCNGSVTDLRQRAKNASGEKAKMYHWCANMKSGKKK